MGRPPLNAEATKQITIRLIQTTHDLILSEGLEGITIRKIAGQAGLNSAILYKYFEDVQELVLFACIDLFQAYSAELSATMAQQPAMIARETYLTTWALFCKHGFAHPECMNHLFFSKHSSQLGRVIEAYYRLFPEQLAGMEDRLQIMPSTAELEKRNLEVLRARHAGPRHRGAAPAHQRADARLFQGVAG